MLGLVIAVGVAFGLSAGVALGLPAFAIGAALATVALVAFDVAAGQGLLSTALRALALLVALQLSYGLGLVARAAFPALRRLAPEPRRRPADPAKPE